MKPFVTWWRSAQPFITAAMAGIAVVAASAPAAHATGDPSAPWLSSIQQVDAALGRKEYSAALRASHDAYGAALASRRWEGMVAAGDAYRRIGEATGLHKSFQAKAREAYLAALFRARQQSALDGVLRAAEAFVTLGDIEVVTQCVRIAKLLAAQDPEKQADVRAFTARLADPALTVQKLQPR